MRTPLSAGNGGGLLNADNATAYIGALPNVYNFGPTKLKKWRVARGKARAGNAHARILCVGDSRTAGMMGGYGTTSNNTLNSYPNKLAEILDAAGLPARGDAFHGYNSNGQRISYDSQITAFTGSWTDSYHDGSYSSCAGGWQFTNTGAGDFTFAPRLPVGTFRIWYRSSTGLGVLGLSIDGGAVQNLDTQTPGGNIETYYDLVCASEGIHTLNMTWVSGGKVCVMGVEPLYTSKKSVTICNAGFDGSKTSDWTYANFSGFSAFYIAQKYTPDLIVLSLGGNDWINSVSATTYRANLLSLVTRYMLSSDVIVIGPEPTSNGGIPLATQRNYIEAARSVALEKGVPFVNLHERFVSAENARDVGLFNTDLTHNTGAGYADVANVLASMLMSA